jgi:FkbM family methyltransferase
MKVFKGEAFVNRSSRCMWRIFKLKEIKQKIYLRFLSLLNSSSTTFTPHGIPIKIPSNIQTSVRYAFARGRPYEEAEAKMIINHLPLDTNVIELGGCLGVISALIRHRIGVNAHHLIVEANPDLTDICLSNATNTSTKNTNIIVAAVDYSNKKYVNFVFGHHMHVGRVSKEQKTGIPTRTTTLSELVKRIPKGPFALICDIEGAEEHLFEREDTLISNISLLILETHPYMYTDGTNTQKKMLDCIASFGLQEIDREGDVVCFKRI